MQVPQLRIIQSAGCLFTIAGNKRHGRPAIQQRNGSHNLALVHA